VGLDHVTTRTNTSLENKTLENTVAVKTRENEA